MSFLKKFLTPIQMRLLKDGKCPACMTDLHKVTHHEYKQEKGLCECRCGRVFIYDKKSKKYDRASVEEAQQFFKGKK